MRNYANYIMAVLAIGVLAACGSRQEVPQVEGHYAYEHAFSYDLRGNHCDVAESGTMDFYADGTGLDSAQQVYTVSRPDGDTQFYVFDYVSPSRWRLDGDTLYFAGDKETFHMTADKEDSLSQEIIRVVGGSIDYPYLFHLDTLTSDRLQWSFSYRDGHSDTWTFFRTQK